MCGAKKIVFFREKSGHFMEILVENDRITVSVGCEMVCSGGICKGIEC